MASPVIKVEISKCKIDKDVKTRKNASILLYIEGNYFADDECDEDIYSAHDQDVPAVFNGKVYQTQPKLLNSGITFLIPFNEKLQSLSMWLVLKDKLDISKSEIIGTSSISVDNIRKNLYCNSNSETTCYILKVENNQKVGKVSFKVIKSPNYSSRETNKNLNDPIAEKMKLFSVDADRFSFRPLNQPIDWDRFRRVCRDLDVIKSTSNTKVASAFLDDVSYGDITYDKNIKNISFVKAIQIAQFATQYLSSTQSTLSKRKNILYESLAVLADEDDALNDELVKYKAKYRALLRENSFLEQLQKENSNLLAILSPELASKYVGTRLMSYSGPTIHTKEISYPLNITRELSNIGSGPEKATPLVEHFKEVVEDESIEEVNHKNIIDHPIVFVSSKTISSEESDSWCRAAQSPISTHTERDEKNAHLPIPSEKSLEDDSLVVSNFDINDDSITSDVPEVATISVEEITVKALKYIETLESEEDVEFVVRLPSKSSVEPEEPREKEVASGYRSAVLSSMGAMSVDSLNANSFINQIDDTHSVASYPKDDQEDESNQPAVSQSCNFNKLEDIEDISFNDREIDSPVNKKKDFIIEPLPKNHVSIEKPVDSHFSFDGVLSRQTRMDEHDDVFSRSGVDRNSNLGVLYNSNGDKMSDFDDKSRNDASKNDNVIGFDLSSDLEESNISIGPIMLEPTKGKMNRVNINRYGNDDDDVDLKPSANTFSIDNPFGRTEEIDDNVNLGGTIGTNKFTSSLTSDLSVSDFSMDQSMELDNQIRSMIPSNTVSTLDIPVSPQKTSSAGPSIWIEGRATADNLEVGMALDFLLSGITFNDNFESGTFYVQVEFMKKKSAISQLFRCVSGGSLQPINFAARINFNRETSVLLSDEIEEQSDNLCMYVNILDGSKRIIGEASVFLYVMIEESTNIIKLQTEIVSKADSDIVIGECVCDVRGFSTLKRCS